jgi:hypothetical protein
MLTKLDLLIVCVLAVPLGYLVHCGLNYCCLVYARRFCRRQGFKIIRWRCGPALEQSGVKTEFTLVELDCLDGQNQQRLVRLLVWLFGIHRVLSDEKYPESRD